MRPRIPLGPSQALLLVSLLLLPAGLTACKGDQSSALSSYLQADLRPSDPSARVQFGRGALPADFPAGLPLLPHASLLGWQRTVSDSSRSWEAIYEAPGDTSSSTATIVQGLKSGGTWQVTDTNSRNGYQELNITGPGSQGQRSGVIAVGPAVSQGRVQCVEEIGEDR